MKIQDWSYLTMAHAISQRSKDPNTKVGAVLVSPDTRRICTGYNGFPMQIEDRIEVLSRKANHQFGLTKDDLVVHAEMNALNHCPVRPEGWTLYITHMPCHKCALNIVSRGVTSVHCLTNEPTTDHCLDKAQLIFKLASVNFEAHDASLFDPKQPPKIRP